MRTTKATAAHHAFRNDVIELLKRHAGHLDATEMLALAAHLTGQIIAMQDQRKITPEKAMEIVSANLEAGNGEVFGALIHNTTGHG